MSEIVSSFWFGDFRLRCGDFCGSDFQILSAEPAEKEMSVLVDRYLSLSKEGVSGVSGIDLRKLAVSSGFCASDAEYTALLREVAVSAAQMRVSSSLTPDKMIIQAVEALDDINETINHLSERLSEWYGAYYPEPSLTGEECARFVSQTPEAASQSEMGAPLGEAEAALLKSFADDICALYDRKSAVEAYIHDKMNAVAPNVSMIAGELLGARLLGMAGGLSRLASFPSGTIQVMGAEKALFRHLRARGPSPKHGLIFNHPLINGAPHPLRGKLARTFAASISLAARTDVYSGQRRPEIKTSLDEKTARIKASRGKNAGGRRSL